MTKNRNDNPCKQWFITFSNSCENGTTKESYKDCFPPMTYYHCGEEDHESGKKHLHAICILKKPLSKKKLIRYVGATHPYEVNRMFFEPTKELDDIADYIIKEDPSSFKWGSNFKYSKETLECERWFINNGYWPSNHRHMSKEELAEWFAQRALRHRLR